MTQRERLVEVLRQRWCTWGDLQATRISTSPHVRLLTEGGLAKSLLPGERFLTRKRADGLVEMRVATEEITET